MLFTSRERSIFVNMEIEVILEELQQHLSDDISIEVVNDMDVSRREAQLILRLDDTTLSLHVDLRYEIRQIHVDGIVDAKQGRHNYVLVAYRLFPKLKEQLRDLGVNYIEANGNMYIKQNGIRLFVDGKPQLKKIKNTGNRAFTKTGLKVLYQILLNEDLMNQTQREIAASSQVALGNIPQVIEGLIETDFLVKYSKREYRIVDKERLIKRWAVEYGQVLKPTLDMGRYRFATEQRWQEYELDWEVNAWGGESAAEYYTNYLRPEVQTLYTRQTRQELFKDYRLVPDPTGDIQVYSMFWRYVPHSKKMVPPILVYADLLNTNDKRCVETANMIYNDFLSK